MDLELKSKILLAQKNEITEHLVYKKLAVIVNKKEHAAILEKISKEELEHYNIFKGLTGDEVGPDNFKVNFYVFMAKMCGLNFVLRFMENQESGAEKFYGQLSGVLAPTLGKIIADEKKHEEGLLDLIDEDSLKYVSSVILGLNDAIVELTAMLAGFTLALNSTRLIGMVSLITGVAAAMSMAASEYLSTKGEANEKDPIKASIYTGVSYLGTVVALVLPYLFLQNVFVCLGIALSIALFEIWFFTFYISVAQKLDFKKRFIEMAVLSLSIAAITFILGIIIKKMFGIDI
ncbi:MAG: VIT1/CCC1 transporter family protein [Candidatus Omnitrophica bacterium]|nr:VIT1/CCC1 transporter family protein [Candidatus Omnitrophota bacterium]